MTASKNKSPTPLGTAMIAKAIPMTSGRIGSWHVMINRRLLSTADLARGYDAVSGKWARKVRRFQLDTAYQELLLASRSVADLKHIKPHAQVLDCGVGNGSLSVALNSIKTGPVEIQGIDIFGEMLLQAKLKMQHAGMNPHLQQADVMSLPYDNQSFDVCSQPVRLGFFAGVAGTAFWARRAK